MDTIMELVSNVVMRYVIKSCIPMREKEDVEMSIIEKILKQQEKINASFENRSNIKTYYIAIINRMCCEIIRSESKHWHLVSDVDIEQPSERSSSIKMETAKSLIINKEFKRLSNVMLFFNDEKSKTLLFLKFLFDIPIGKIEAQEYCKEKYNEIKPLLNRGKNISQADLYNTLANITYKVEGKEVKGDAIRMWMNKQIELILKRMNNFDESYHSRDSLKILIELGYAQFQNTTIERKLNLWTLNKQKNEK